MEGKNGRERSSEVWERSQGSKSKGESRSMGAFPTSSESYGSNQIGTCRKDSDKSDTLVAAKHSANEVTGKFVSQLIDETEKQLAYHEQQTELLRDRLKELRRIPENLLESEQIE